MILKLSETEYIKTENPIDISIPIHNRENPVLAWYCDPIKLEPVMTDRFVGDVNQGGAVNFRNLYMNPHAHGTHTECLGHISKEWTSINQTLKEFHFKAVLITVDPVSQVNSTDGQTDNLITPELIELAVEPFLDRLADVPAIVIRTLPNGPNKKATNYSNTNPTFFTKEAIQCINHLKFEHLIVDLPSIDREEDGGELIAHHTFWNYPKNPQHHKTISELVYISDDVTDDIYLSNIQITSLENDASPSKIVLYKIEKT